ncbi:anti-sigma factor [Mucilaginibacter auburnensis]|uniref:Regulator of SigK n=1 Tax=Mucilaginibacter auburnensis TaxID=1457233 RepID=A0A2H9VSA7_9SPHI|nr:anti-sigma factor [Mucilaginibacter auburnensis]PJJ83700.1 anti-sigma-K factor RskA [Mucilaginibacter auburnensis]
MNEVKAYIESGILELYVLGDVSPEERVQVEQMAATHPAIKAELHEVEQAMEFYAEENAVQPSEQHRARTLGSVLTNFADDTTFDKKRTQPEANVVQLNPPGKGSFYKYAFAASLVMLIGSLVALYNVYNKLQHSNQQLLVLNTQNERFSKVINQMGEEISVFRDPSFKLLTLKGTDKMPSAKMTVAWSPVKKKVMIDMGGTELPKNDTNHQYQLWAIVNGKPVDLGVFDKAIADSVDMVPMKPVALASAFAVTLEPRGGSVNPTMNEMVVIGQF